MNYGTTTGRPRRCGWIDIVMLRYAVRVSGITSLALTKLDTLAGLEKIKICTGYKINGKIIEDFPASLEELKMCEPIYEEMEGWSENIQDVRSFEDLPLNAKKYVKRLEETRRMEFSIISVGPEREETIVLRNF